jgi:hypothetical protein
LSTITDLFNVKIGVSRRAVFAELRDEALNLLLSPEKLPLREELRLECRDGESLQEVLAGLGVEKENLYCVLPQGACFRNRITLPFSDRQKIDGVIRYEVLEYLPDPEGEYLTDFYNVENEVYTFSTPKERIESLLGSLGSFRENLRSVLPYETALMYAMHALVDDDTYMVLDMGRKSVYVQAVEGMHIRLGALFKTGQGDSGPEQSDAIARELRPQLIMALKSVRPHFVYLNTRGEGAHLGEMIQDLLREQDVSFQEVPHYKIEREMRGSDGHDAADALIAFGALQETNGQPSARVSLLRDEFKPRMKGYVSVREFSIAGALLLALLILSTIGLTLGQQSSKNQVAALRRRVQSLSSEVYGDPAVSVDQAKARVGQVEDQLSALRSSTDRRFSSLQLLRELSFYIPTDIVVEYSDIIIERDRIKFSGKARTFSDIDRLREQLLLSEYFSDVRVSNTGTTGSTQGFTVTFVFDIDVVEELSFGD